MSPAPAPFGARPVASFKSIRAWCVVAAGLVVYAVLSDVLIDRWVRIEALIPWVVTLLVPPAFYAVLLALFFRPLSWVRWAAITIGLWAVHLLLGMTAVAFVALLDGHYTLSKSPPFPPPPVPQILWVPLLLFPLRDLVASRVAPPRRGARSGAPRPRPATPAAPAGPSPVKEAPVAHPAPAASQPARAPVAAAPAPAQPPVRPALPVAVTPERPASVLVRPPAASAQPATPAAPSPAQRVLDQMLADSPSQDDRELPSVRIPFERVADQFPAEVFRASLAEVAAGLSEPGVLLVPQRLALLQVGEGLVRIGWEVVSRQFPRDLLAVGDEGIRRRIPDGQLVLPLDEVVRQMPEELFAPAQAYAEPEGLGDIPDVFRVEASLAASAAPAAAAAPRPETPPAPAAAAPRPAATSAPAPVASGPAPRPAPVASPPAAPQVAPSPAAYTAPGPGRPVPVSRPAPSVPVDQAGPGPAEDAEAEPGPSEWPEAPAREALAAAPAHSEPSEDEPTASLRGIAERLSPLVPLDMASTEVDGIRLLTLQSPVVDPYLAVTAAHAFVPLLADPRAPWGIEQVTVRGQDAAVILTPLGGPGAGMLVAAVPRCGTLALLELVCRRQAGAGRGGAAPAGGAEGDIDLDPELIEVEPTTRLRRLASSLDAVGPVRVSALRDPENQHSVYLFLPDGSDVRGAGGFTAEVARALRRVGQPGTFDTAIVRGGRQHMVIRLAGADDTAVVAAAGETRAPGLAHRQVADVAGAVATS